MRLSRAIVAVVAIAGVLASCGPSEGPPIPSLRGATTYREWAEGACRAFDALWEAVGNPETGNQSELRGLLERAVAARNSAEADRLVGLIDMRLSEGRREAVAAAGWEPGKPMMIQLDRLLGAYQAEAAAKRAIARGQGGAQTPQEIWQAAGGLDAWHGMFEAGAAIPDQPTPFGRCPNVPISL